MRRSASVDLPWSICATMEKLRMFEMGIAVMNRGIASVHFPAKWNPVSRKKMLKIIDLSGFPVAKPVSVRRNTCSPRGGNLISSRQADSTSGQNALRNGHDRSPVLARDIAWAPPIHDAAWRGVARGLCQRRQGKPAAGGRLRRPARRALDRDSDRPEDRAGCALRRRRGLRLGPKVPARLRSEERRVGKECR